MRSFALRSALFFSLLSLVVPAAVAPAAAAPNVRTASPVAATTATAADPAAKAAAAPVQDLEPVELVDRRTERSTTYLQPDGSFRSEVFTTPVHFRGDTGPEFGHLGLGRRRAGL